MPFFRDQSPPHDGNYLVRWEPGDMWIHATLKRVQDEPQDEPPSHDVERWVWYSFEGDGPESICTDITDPLGIEWRAIAPEIDH